jgi:hypothetical protein
MTCLADPMHFDLCPNLSCEYPKLGGKPMRHAPGNLRALLE